MSKYKRQIQKNPQGTPYATPDITATRVDEIYHIMRMGEWIRSKSAVVFAAQWGISRERVEQLSAEAWRRVCHESNDPEEMRPEIAAILRTNLMRADEVRNFRAIASLAETYTKVIGARAPERHEHAVIIAQFDSMTRDGKIAWIDQRIAKLQEAREALVELENE